MSRDQKFVIAALVLGNLLLYVLAFYSMPAQTAQAPVSPPPTIVQVAAVAPAAGATDAPAATDVPADTATPKPTITPTEIPTATPTPTETPTSTPTPPATLPAGASLRFTPVPPTKPVILGGTPLYPPPTRTPRPATATPVPTKAPTGGTDPSNALQPSDAWRTIGPNTSVWYKIGTGGYHIVATLQANPLEGMRMEVFAPNIWDKPIGAGSRTSGVDGLVWAGGRWEDYGDWFARVTNSNSGPVTYRLMTNAQEIPDCEIIGYWEYIGPNLVYWKKCK